jgi:DNA-binding response OmpR family regulator
VILAREPVDLVIRDVYLENERGLEALARLRETSDLPVLPVNGYGTKETFSPTGNGPRPIMPGILA